MGKIKVGAFIIFAVPSVLVASYFFILIVNAFSKGFTISEMDWNESGYTSLLEMAKGSDIIKRDAFVNNKKCTEYISMKDASTIKVMCPP